MSTIDKSTADNPLIDARNAKRAKSNPNVLKQARQLHLLLGIFFAPALIFFALSGALQTIGLHEGAPGSSYQPPVWIQKMAQVHKKQTAQLRPERRPDRQPGPENGPPSSEMRRKPTGPEREGREEQQSSLVLKGFVLLMSIGLITTSALGIYMAFRFNRDRRLIWALLIAGTALPIILLLF